jgi:hypothetical protein
MIGYVTSWDGIAVNSAFGQTQVGISRSVQQSRARVLGRADYDLDGYESPVQRQNFVAQFNDTNGNVNTRAMYQRLGRSGWLTCKSRDGADKQNWAKLISIDTQYTPNNWITSDSNPYTLTWSCSPYWYSTSSTTTALSSVSSVSLTNSGNAPSSWLIMYITGAISTSLVVTIGRNSGSTYNIPKYGQAIYDASDQPFRISYDVPKSSGPILAINFLNNSVTINGNDDYADVTIPATQTGFGYMFPGSTRFTFSQNVVGSIEYRSAYV